MVGYKIRKIQVLQEEESRHPT